MFLHLHGDDYDIAGDYKAMVEGTVNPKLAWLICLMRKVLFSFKNLAVNMAETVSVDKMEDTVTLDGEVTEMLKKQSLVVQGIVQQSITILALNGISLVSRGHHYNDGDQWWERLEAASQLDAHFTTLKVNDWRGRLYHDAFHPFDYDWVASLITSRNTPIAGNINGVALKRLGTLPAGTTHVGLVAPIAAEVMARNRDLYAKLKPAVALAEADMAKIRKNPLDFCAHLPRSGTKKNLDDLAGYEKVVAFCYGYLTKLGLKKGTVLSAKSLGNIAARQSVAFLLGQQATQAYDQVEISKEEIDARLREIIDVKGEGLKGEEV